MKLNRTGALAFVIAAIASCHVAFGQSSYVAAGSDETLGQGDDLSWGDSREVVAAVRRLFTEQLDVQLEEGGYVDQGVTLSRLPKGVLPAMNPFADLDLHVVLSARKQQSFFRAHGAS